MQNNMSISPIKGKSIGFWSTVAIGIGGMVGGGIFAVLGLAVQIAGGGTPLAFLITGVVALLTAYSYSKLSVAYPTRGGTVEFLNQAFGPGLFIGGMNVLLSLSYIIMLSLYAYAFGSYGASFFPAASRALWRHIFTSGVIIIFTCLNILGARAVGRSENYIVAIKILILAIFLGFGLWSVNTQNVAPAAWSSPLQVAAGGMVIFLAYEGFELIANTAENVRNPRRTLPPAYFTSVLFVVVLYVLVSLVTVGSLSINSIVSAKDYALAEAARPFLGSTGFTLIAVAALLSTASAINATLYGTTRVSYIIAKEGELPAILDREVWQRPIEGLLITSGLTLLVANLFDLSSISTMGSSGFLLIFAAVNLANFQLAKRKDSQSWISLIGTIICLMALVVLIIQRATSSPAELLVLVIMVAVSFVIEVVYRRATGRIIRPMHKAG
jgi:amino acid transporter